MVQKKMKMKQPFLFPWLHCRSYPRIGSFLKKFSYKDIQRATDNFQRIIDNSSRGATYKAKLQSGTDALVKEDKVFYEDEDAFYREVQLLGRLNHRHIITLSGFSVGHRRFLVFEDMENGSLKEHLNDPLKTPLNWRTRLKIAVGVAAALEYLLFFCDPPVYHISISSSTIMLDENFTAKISDIGLVGSGGNQVTLPHKSCSKDCAGQVCGHIVFQLGLLILELITGQSSGEGGVDLIQWVNESCFSKSVHDMLDPDLGNNYNAREVKRLLAVARLCVKSVDKPTIFVSQIFWYLQNKVGITGNLKR